MIFQYSERAKEVSIYNLTETMLDGLIINKIVMRKTSFTVWQFLVQTKKAQSKEIEIDSWKIQTLHNTSLWNNA